MRTIEEALNLNSLEEVEKEISERTVLMNQMVGWLYKGVIQEEISKLNRKRWSMPVVKFKDE